MITDGLNAIYPLDGSFALNLKEFNKNLLWNHKLATATIVEDIKNVGTPIQHQDQI